MSGFSLFYHGSPICVYPYSVAVMCYDEVSRSITHVTRMFHMEQRFVKRPVTRSRLFIVFSVVCGLWLITLTASAFSEGVVYESDFSSDPGWIAGQPENFYWDAQEEVLFVRTMNTPDSDTARTRYFYTETALNPRLSHSVSWDMKILSMSPLGNTSGVAVFGLYGENLYGFNSLNLNFVGSGQDGTFSMRLMALDGFYNRIFTHLNTGYDLDISTTHVRGFGVDRWYRFTLRYDAPTYTYHYEMRDRDTNQLLFSTSIENVDREAINPDLRYVGITMHPEGTGATNLNTSTRRNGFAEYLIDNVVVRQVYDETYTEPPSVLFLPGIQASRLYTAGLFGTEDRVWEPNNKGDVLQLAMTEAGESVENIYTRDSLGAVFGFADIYDSFEESLASMRRRGEISDWHTFAYDWRFAVDTIVENGTAYEEEVLSLVETVLNLAQRNNSKVAIVAHSNGGLLAKALAAKLEELGKSFLIDQIIFVGTPQLGTPKTVGALLHGYDQQQLHGWLLDEVTARSVLRNMPAVYGLLPSESYMESGDAVVQFSVASTTEMFTNVYGNSITTFSALQEFLVGTQDGRGEAVRANEAGTANPVLLHAATALQESLEEWRAPAEVSVTEIVGVGFDTVKGFDYQEFKTQDCVSTGVGTICIPRTYYEPVAQFTQYGDETVVAKSGEGYKGPKATYYVDLLAIKNDQSTSDVEHANIMRSEPLQLFVRGLLQKTSVSVPYISNTKPAYNDLRDVIAVHSPVTISATDAFGRVVGRQSADGVPKMEIPGAFYYEIGGAKYIILPKNTIYTTTIRGMDVMSGYTMTIGSYAGEDEVVELARFSNATVTPNMVTTFAKTSDGFTDVLIDYDDDGMVDEVRTVDGGVPRHVYFDQVRAIISGFTTLKDSERSWLLNALSRAERTGLRKGDDASGVVRVLGQVDGRLVSHLEKGMILESDYQNLQELFGQIINQ